MSLPAYAMNLSSFPETYERCLVGPLFRPWAETILDDVDLAPGDRVLDVACGTGIVARLARERLGEAGRVVGVDISPAMLAVARTAAPAIDWREGDACALPLRDAEKFDVVVCQQGLQFFPDKPAGARWPPTAGSRWRPGAPRTRSRCSTRCIGSRNGTWAASSTSATASATPTRFDPCSPTQAWARSASGP
ncbi:MAG: class I SAM-dependent methyltransferase [Burkholderiaceae bacterium]|nr:class I SAM-dependent methyltransferase [Burkholderiaceae bacterium]